MKKQTKPIQELNQFVDTLIRDLETCPLENILEKASKVSPDMKTELHKRFGYEHFKNMLSALTKGNKAKAILHTQRVKKQIIPVANDFPFRVGNMVYVNRYEHGWNPGWTAKIKEVHQTGGIYYYTATIIEGGKHQYDITIDHTRDASLA